PVEISVGNVARHEFSRPPQNAFGRTNSNYALVRKSLTRSRRARRTHRGRLPCPYPYCSATYGNQSAIDHRSRTHDSSARGRCRPSCFPALLLLFLGIFRVIASGLLPLRHGGRSLVVLHRHVALVGRDLHPP